jgi:LysM repeat protein/ABC-type branched-subunit amino acid transport system substrate-binding protein
MNRISFFILLWASGLLTINVSAQNNQSATSSIEQGDVFFYHTIERGQTIYSIATMYKVKVDDILKLNSFTSDKINVGDKLKIPQVKQKAETVKSKREGDGDEPYLFHTIQSKETLYGLSQKYGISGQQIVDANPGLSQEAFSIGKTIRIPTKPDPQSKSTVVVEVKKGSKEIYYTVPANETIYNIMKKFRTTGKELLKLNPELAGGLRTGMIIRIPMRINEEEFPKEEELDAGSVNALLSEKAEVKLVNASKVALLLPYDPKSNSSRNRNGIVEYYEGFLLATDSIRKQGHSCELFVYDIGEGTTQLKNILKENLSTLRDINLIIGGVTNEQIKLIADFSNKNKVKYVIPYTSKNDEVLNNPYIFQVNTPQQYLYANAAYAAANLFAKSNIIILDTKDKDSQTDFINELKKDLNDRNIQFKDVVYDAEKFSSTLPASLSTTKPNVIIPVSNTLEALMKIKTVLRNIAETKPEYKINLFGYPVWQTYTKDCLEDFHALDTYIYSLFYADNLNPAVKRFYNDYKKWYSKNPTLVFLPKYSMLGFDTGMYFLKAIQQYGSNFEDNLSSIKSESIQTGFDFKRVNNWGGFVNTNIYIVHYKKDFTITRTDFK